MSSREAQAIANSKNLDLVKISPNAKPPVCKIMDYGKYKYEQSRKEKEARKNQKTVTVKEIRLRPGIESNDLKEFNKPLDVKIKNFDKGVWHSEIQYKGGKYYLISNGIKVTPDKVSTGERNIIALCYFILNQKMELILMNRN